jgi:RNA polymerase sigma factor (sigma-70 family)
MEDREVIFKKYSKKIYNLAFRMTGDSNDASDIMQDTFIQGFESLDKFRGESQVYTWLYKIAKNKCIRLLEKRKRTGFVSLQELIENCSSPISDELSEEEKTSYISQVKDGCLSGLLRCLSLKQRLAFILNVLLDVPVEQVAGIINKSENATRILIHRARQKIRDFLCSNCSLMNSENNCHCENLVNFSLSKGWIRPDNSMVIEREIKEVKTITDLYKELQEKQPDSEFEKQVQQLIAGKNDFLIFNGRKVK